MSNPNGVPGLLDYAIYCVLPIIVICIICLPFLKGKQSGKPRDQRDWAASRHISDNRVVNKAGNSFLDIIVLFGMLVLAGLAVSFAMHHCPPGNNDCQQQTQQSQYFQP